MSTKFAGKLVFSVLVGSMFLGATLSVSAQAPTAESVPTISAYSIHLIYSAKDEKLDADRTPAFLFDMVYNDFAADVDLASAKYVVRVIDVKGKSLYEFGYDPLVHGGKELGQGLTTTTAIVPYFADAKSVEFIRGGKSVLSIDVSMSSFCNQDNKCNTAIGEEKNLCPLDCGGTRVLPSVLPLAAQATQQPGGDKPGTTVGTTPGSDLPAPVDPGTPPVPSQSTTPSTLIMLAVLGVVIVFTLYLLIRRFVRKEHSESSL